MKVISPTELKRIIKDEYISIKRLNRLNRLYKKATDGSWYLDCQYDVPLKKAGDRVWVAVNGMDEVVCVPCQIMNEEPYGFRDYANFIVAAHNEMPYLLQELERLKNEVKMLEKRQKRMTAALADKDGDTLLAYEVWMCQEEKKNLDACQTIYDFAQKNGIEGYILWVRVISGLIKNSPYGAFIVESKMNGEHWCDVRFGIAEFGKQKIYWLATDEIITLTKNKPEKWDQFCAMMLQERSVILENKLYVKRKCKGCYYENAAQPSQYMICIACSRMYQNSEIDQYKKSYEYKEDFLRYFESN